jgi:hypothetical protein
MTKIKGFQTFINENLKDNLVSLQGTPIDLIKTLKTTGSWNPDKQDMDKVEKKTEVSGIVGEIGVDEDGRVSPGFMLVDRDNKKLGFVMYDAKRGEFIEGESTFDYTYTGKDSKDNIILQLMKDNLV